MAPTVKWLRISDATDLRTVRSSTLNFQLFHAHKKYLNEETGRFEIPGVYVNEACTRLKVVYTEVTRDKRGMIRRRQRTKGFHRKREYPEGNALDAAVAFKERVDEAARSGMTPEPDHATTTVDELFELFLSSKPRRPLTVATYRAVYGHRIQPAFGSWLVGRVGRHDLEKWSAEAGNGSPSAQRVAVKVVKAMFAYAYKRGILQANPSLVLTPGQDEVRSISPDEVLTPEQVKALADEAGDRYSALIFFLAYGGVRVGEAVALERSKVDVKRGRVVIDRSASEVQGRLTFGRTKTKGSTRTITLPRFVVDQLAGQVERYPTDTGLVFSAPDGGPLRPNNFRKRVYAPALERAGLPHQSIHALRHVCASQLAGAGGSAVEIAARLGHSNPAITQRVYTHLLATRDERLAELQQEAFAGGQGDVLAELKAAVKKRKGFATR